MIAPARRPRIASVRLSVFVMLAALATPAAVLAQTPPPKAKTHDLALNWLKGRWSQPVTCERADGSTFARERALSFRVAPGEGAGRTALRATFYGIDAPDAVRCYNLIESELLDLRGVVHLHVRAHNREDMGIVDFRRMLADGSLDYYVTRGRLRWRPIGADADWTAVEVPEGSRLHLDPVLGGSDGARLFEAHDLMPDPRDPHAPRLMQFELREVPELSFSIPLREDRGRKR